MIWNKFLLHYKHISRPIFIRKRSLYNTPKLRLNNHTESNISSEQENKSDLNSQTPDKNDAEIKTEKELPKLKEEDDFMKKLEEKQKEISRLKNEYLLLLAQQQNTKREGDLKIKTKKTKKIGDFFSETLSIIDAYDNAFKLIPEKDEISKMENVSIKDFYNGIYMTYSALITTFRRNGFHTIEGNEVEFDTKLHEPLKQEVKIERGQVVVLTKVGFIYGNEVIRKAKVVLKDN